LICLPPGLGGLAGRVDTVLTKTRRKYKEYGIKEKPLPSSRRQRAGRCGPMGGARCQRVKPRWQRYRRVVCQAPSLCRKGVLTNERINDAVAEPVVYMMDRYVVGGFYRVHADQADHRGT
jgi:glutamate--cysteine ligase